MNRKSSTHPFESHMPAPSGQINSPVIPDLIVLAVLGAAAATISWFGFQIHACIFTGFAVIGLLILKHPEIGILFFLTTFLFTYPPFLRGIGILTPNNLLGAVFAVLLAERVFRKNGAWFLRIPQVQLLFGIGIVFLIATYFSKASPEFASTADRTRKELWDFYTQSIFLIFLINFIRTRNHLKAIFALLLFAIILSAVSSLYFIATTGEFSRAIAKGGIKMAQNSNHLAFYSLIGLVFFYYLLQETKNWIYRGFLGAMTVIFLLVILLSASRNSFLNLFVFFGVLTIESHLELRKIVLVLLLGGLLLVLALHLVPKQHLDRLTALKMDPTQKEASSSMSERKQALQVGLRIFLDSNPLLGVGPGNFRWIRQTYYDHKRVATHNAYLWALVSGGLPALLLFLLLFWTSWKDLAWMARQKTEAFLPPKWMIRSTRTILIQFMLFSLFTESFLEIMPFLLVGATIIMKRSFLARSRIYAVP